MHPGYQAIGDTKSSQSVLLLQTCAAVAQYGNRSVMLFSNFITITILCSVYRKMNLETLQISSVIKKPPDERSREDLEEILPYLTKRSELLSNLQKGKRSELLSNLQKGKRSELLSNLQKGTSINMCTVVKQPAACQNICTAANKVRCTLIYRSVPYRI